MKDLSPQKAHRDYVSGVLSFYRENDIQPGDPNEGAWEEAHYPKPKRLGGTETIWLLKEHHAVQGVLQSEEYQCCCVSGLYMKYVKDTEYEERMSWWLGEQLRKLNAEPWTDERRVRAGERLKGKTAAPFTQEHRAKLTIANRKRWDDPGYRQKMRRAVSKMCVVTDLETGVQIDFTTQNDACSYIGCSPQAISWSLRTKKPIFKRYTIERP